LLEPLKKGSEPRIVMVSSRGHFKAGKVDFDNLRKPTKSLTGFPEYCVSKLANVVHAQKLAELLKEDGITTYAVHPGVIASDIWRRIPQPFRWLFTSRMKTNEEGAYSTIHAASASELSSQSGRYYHEDGEPKTPSALARDKAFCDRLWSLSMDGLRGFTD
ncbi:MAG: hypothetical protein KC561_20035, partial [Myxococcales bacterium]|nr:hypothetical protein [Myxococcales bacterium]